MVLNDQTGGKLPRCASDYIELVAKKVRYRRKVRADIRQELTGHFEDALCKCASDAERQETARNVIADFGDPKMLAKLIRRGKKRCRPLWLKALIRTCQVLGIMILLIVIRIASLSVGTPGHAIDHYAKLTELGRGGLDDSQNAGLVLEKAASVMVETPKWLENKSGHLPLDINDVELAELKGWLDSNAEALNLVRAASVMPGRWVDYHPIPEPNTSTWASKGLGGVMFSAVVLGQSLPDLSSARELIYMLKWHSLCEAQDGHMAVAVDEAIAIVRLGTLYEGKGFLVDNMVGIAVETMGETLLCEITATGKCDAILLADAQGRLQQLYREHQAVMSLSGEKVLWDEIIQSSHTDSGRMLIGAMPLLWRDWSSSLKGFAFGFPSRADSQKMVDDYFAIVERANTRTPWRRRVEGNVDDKLMETSGTMMLRLEGPALVKVADLGWRAKAQRDATISVLAIERYRLEKGRLPESLDEVVKGGYLTELPMDPWSDGPLAYRKTADDYTLYSVGYDFTDNGGIPKPKDKPQDTPGCDNVYWPAQ